MNRLYNLPNKIIAVTGGIASGKSYKCKQLEAEGKHVMHADKIVKKIYKYKPMQAVLVSMGIRSDYAKSFINDDLSPNFKELREYVFENDRELDYLEKCIATYFEGEFLKEYIERGLNRALYNCEKGSIDYQDIYFEYAPERLIDINLFDRVIRCEAPRDIRIERIVKRDGCSKETAIKMIERQES